MPESKRLKKRSRLRGFLLAVFLTAGILVLLCALLVLVAMLTVDKWIVPLGVRITGVEIEGTPGVIVSIPNREIILTDLVVKRPEGRIELKSCGLKLDGLKLENRQLREIRVSQVHAEGVRAELDFGRLADASDEPWSETISGEKVRDLSHTLWNKASKPVLHISDLTLLDTEVRWKSGVEQSLISISDLTSTFEDGLLTRPHLVCGMNYRLNDSQRSIQLGARIKAVSARDGESVIVSASGEGPLVIDLPDSHLEFPAMESTDMIVQYEPESAALRFGGEWSNPDRWEYDPLDLSMEDLMLDVFGTLALDGEKLRLRFGTSARGSDILCREHGIPGEMILEAKCNVDFDLVTGGVTLDSLSGYLTGPNGGRISLGTSGVFEFVRHEDATYTLDPQAARLTIETAKPIDLAPFDPVLPFDAADKTLSGVYFIELDPETVRLHGGADVEIGDEKTHSRVFCAKAVFETDGVTRIRSFNVSHCEMDIYDDEDRICHALFTGEYNIRTALLNGDMKYYPYRMIESFGGGDLAEMCVYLDDANLRYAEHDAVAELELDLVNMAAKLHKESQLTHLALTGSNGKSLELEAIGDADFRLAPDDRGWQLHCGLDLKAGNDFHAWLNTSGGSDTAFSSHVEVDKLSDVLARQLEHKFFPGGNELPVLRFLNVTASADFLYDPSRSRIELSGFNAELDNGDGRVTLQSSSKFVWANGAFQRLSLDCKLKTISLPVSFWEPLLGEDNYFQLADGVLTSELNLSIDADGKLIRGQGMLIGTDLAILLDGSPREIARLGANGSFVFNRENMFAIVSELNIDIQDRQARPTLFVSGAGTVDLADDCRTRMKFSEARFGPEILYLIGYGVQRSFYFEALDLSGEINFDAERNFREMGWTGGLNVNRLKLQSDEPDEYQFPELSGRIEGDMNWAHGEMFGDVAIRLADAEGEDHISGRYLYRDGEDTLPKFVSSSLDLPFAVSYFMYNHNTDPGVEKTALSLVDKTFELDLHGIYTRNHSMILSMTGLMELRNGDDPAILVEHAVFSGDVSGTASTEVHVKEGTWPFVAETELNTIPFDKCFMAFLAADDNQDIPHGLHGFIKRLKATVRGEGFTAEALKHDLQVDCDAELEDVSLRSSLRDNSLFLNILLLPLVSVPRLIDYVPIDVVRRVLRLATAGELMDMISGEAPIEFKSGRMELSVRNGTIDLKEFLLKGDLLEEYSAHGTIDLAGEAGAELETNTRFALFFWPFYLSGDILDPEVSYGKSITHFFTDNTKHLLTLFPNMIMSVFSQEDADEIDRKEAEKRKAEQAEKAEQEKK